MSLVLGNSHSGGFHRKENWEEFDGRTLILSIGNASFANEFGLPCDPTYLMGQRSLGSIFGCVCSRRDRKEEVEMEVPSKVFLLITLEQLDAVSRCRWHFVAISKRLAAVAGQTFFSLFFF